MRLKTLELYNFRQFYGTQSIEFAPGGQSRNVTVIHGFNGAGKTALLNAFVWCLYGETTPDFEEPERLENERAVAELRSGAEIKVGVRIQYDAQGDTYIVERSRRVEKEAGGEAVSSANDLLMWRVRPNGRTEDVGDTEASRQLRIEQLLPKALYPFFFFNGERVERLASADAYDDVEHGVKTLLDVEVFERAMSHLNNSVSGELSRELKACGGRELAEAIAEEERIFSEVKGEEERLSRHRENAKGLADEIERLEAKQEKYAHLAKLAAERKAIREKLTRADEAETALVADLSRHVSQNGYLAFAEPAFRRTEELIAGARQRGEIPAKIKPQFVDDLVKARRCVCGTPLAEGSAEQRALLKWRDVTGLAELEESISQTGASLSALRQRRTSYQEEIKTLQSRRSALLTERSKLKEALAILEQQIGQRSEGDDAAEVAALLQKRRSELQSVHVEIAVVERSIKALGEQLTRSKQVTTRLKAQDAKAQLVQRQKRAVENVASAFQAIFSVQKESVRVRLDELLGTIWKDAAIKDYKASIGSDYRLSLTKRTNGVEQPVYGASTGEKQVLALSFVASLVKTAADHLKQDGRSKVLGNPLGGDYPLVMDSAFGSLEDEYRRKVAEWVPKLAHQVVVLASNSQWRIEVETALQDRVGAQYVLELHTSKDTTPRYIELNGRKSAYVVPTRDAFEYTVIKPGVK